MANDDSKMTLSNSNQDSWEEHNTRIYGGSWERLISNEGQEMTTYPKAGEEVKFSLFHVLYRQFFYFIAFITMIWLIHSQASLHDALRLNIVIIPW